MANPKQPEAPTIPEGHVTYRVTKKGDGKVSRGVHLPSLGEQYLAWKEEATAPEAIAKELEDRELVEII